MAQEIRSINLSGVNGYLVRAGDGFILIDTGMAAQRGALVKARAAGPGTSSSSS